MPHYLENKKREEVLFKRRNFGESIMTSEEGQPAVEAKSRERESWNQEKAINS